MAKSKLIQTNKKIEKKVVERYKKIEDAVVGGYKNIEDQFVGQYLTREGESVADAKKRLKEEQSQRTQDCEECKAFHKQKIAGKHSATKSE